MRLQPIRQGIQVWHNLSVPEVKQDDISEQQTPGNLRDSAVTIVAATEEITIGLNWGTAKSPRIISTANNAPATGALNAAAIPEAAPQATNVRILLGLTLKN